MNSVYDAQRTSGNAVFSAQTSSAAGSITGTGAATQAPNTAAAAGAVSISGAAATTQTLNATAAAGSVLVAGAESATQAPNSASASGATSGSSAQFLRPLSDISAGAWTPSSGGTLFAMLNEAVANDANYITTTSASTCAIAMGAGGDPLSSVGHTIRYRARGTGALTVSLRQGAALIATHTPALTASFQSFAYTLSAAEADAITNYGALRLEVASS